MSGRPDRSSEAARWLAYATDDLRIARHTVATVAQCPFWLVAYHAQQAVEKALKAVLVFQGTEVPFTHHIPTLIDGCVGAGAGERLRTLRDEAEGLTMYATSAKYPFPGGDVTAAEAAVAIAVADKMLKAVRTELAEMGYRT